MKLLLASNGGFLINSGYNLIGIPKEKIKIGWVTTASKGVSDLSYLDRHKLDMQTQNLNFEEFDIENKTTTEIREFFKDKNVMHVEGGNTFYLLKVVKESGFDKFIKEFLNERKIYVGTSAGAYICCPTIATAKLGRNANKDYGLTNFNALNLVPFLLKVHYTDDMRKTVEKFASESEYPLRILRDGQGILIENDQYALVGEGEEVKL